jgi:hypothetical protein
MCLIQIYKDLKNYQGALRIAAIGLVILPDLKDKFIQHWAKIKNCALTENCKDIKVGQNCIFNNMLIQK